MSTSHHWTVAFDVSVHAGPGTCTQQNPTYRYFNVRLTGDHVGRYEPPATPRPRPAPAIHLNASDIPRRGTRTASQLAATPPQRRAAAHTPPKQQKPLKSRAQRGQRPPPPASPTHPAQPTPPLLPPRWLFNFRAIHAINAPICTRSSQKPRFPRAARESQVDSARVSQNRTTTLYSI